MNGNKGEFESRLSKSDDGKGTCLFSGSKIKSKRELLQKALEP